MKMNKDSRLYRWTYFLTYRYERPTQTTLCRFFWRAFVFMPLFWGAIVGGLSASLFLLAKLSWLTKGIFPAILATAFLVYWLLNHYSRTVRDGARSFGYKVEDVVEKVLKSVFWQGVKAVKGKFCPIIRFESKS